MRRDQSLFDFIELALSEGISSIELSGSGGHVADVEERLLRYKNDKGCTFLVHNYFPVPLRPFVLNIASSDRAALADSRELAENALHLAAKLGSGLYSVHAGYTRQPAPPTDGQHFRFAEGLPGSRETALGVLAESVACLCKLGQSLGVALALENLFPPSDGDNYSLLCTADEIDQTFDELGEYDNLGLLLDIGHAGISAKQIGFDLMGFFDTVIARHRSRLLGIHISANDGVTDQHLLPDLAQTAELLTRYELDKLPVTVEARNSGTAQVIEFCRELANLTGTS